MELTKTSEIFNSTKLNIGEIYKVLCGDLSVICMLSRIEPEELTFIYPCGNYTAVVSIHISKVNSYEIEKYCDFSEWFNSVIK